MSDGDGTPYARLRAAPAAVGLACRGGFLPERCRAHVESEQGTACRARGCLARYACPVAAAHRYDTKQAAFHLQAFIGAAPQAFIDLAAAETHNRD